MMGSFTHFSAFRKQNEFSINNTIIRKGRKSQLIFFPRAWFPSSECRAPVWGWPEPGNHRDSGSDSRTLGSGLDQSISSVTQLTWAEWVPRQHSEPSREEVVCDVWHLCQDGDQALSRQAPGNSDREKVLSLVFHWKGLRYL